MTRKERILNRPDDRWNLENVPWAEPDRVYFKCHCGCETFTGFGQEYSTWLICTQCGKFEEVHSG